MRLRFGNNTVATVNDTLIDAYKEINNISMSSTELVRFIIEKELLHEPLRSETEIEYAKRLAGYSYFDSIGAWVEFWMHKNIENKLAICKNCVLRNKEDDYCFEMQKQINPNCSVCSGCHAPTSIGQHNCHMGVGGSLTN